jgi:hypothetical protein
LKKRTKKLLDIGVRLPERPQPNIHKFFGSFFQKRSAFFPLRSILEWCGRPPAGNGQGTHYFIGPLSSLRETFRPCL